MLSECGYPRTISSSEFMPFLQWFLPRYFILCCPLVDKFFHTVHPIYQEIHQPFKCIQNMTTFLHLRPSPCYHPLPPVLIICSAIWYPSFHPVPLQLILKRADSMILRKDKIDRCYSISIGILHLWPFHFFIPFTLATQTSLTFLEHSRGTPVL